MRAGTGVKRDLVVTMRPYRLLNEEAPVVQIDHIVLNQKVFETATELLDSANFQAVLNTEPVAYKISITVIAMHNKEKS